MLPGSLCTTTAPIICVKSELSVPHRFWLDVRAQPSRITLDYGAIWCGCISSKVADKARFLKFSNYNSVSSSISRRVRYRQRQTTFFAPACQMTFGSQLLCCHSCWYFWSSVHVHSPCHIWYIGWLRCLCCQRESITSLCLGLCRFLSKARMMVMGWPGCLGQTYWTCLKLNYQQCCNYQKDNKCFPQVWRQMVENYLSYFHLSETPLRAFLVAVTGLLVDQFDLRGHCTVQEMVEYIEPVFAAADRRSTCNVRCVLWASPCHVVQNHFLQYQVTVGSAPDWLQAVSICSDCFSWQCPELPHGVFCRIESQISFCLHVLKVIGEQFKILQTRVCCVSQVSSSLGLVGIIRLSLSQIWVDVPGVKKGDCILDLIRTASWKYVFTRSKV